ncbi:MAG: hypothetical protein K6F37_04390 [Lachnospiraceae bacterium]|nr:hypothetical protein [Lachnospiraceae bacterium]
MADKQITDLDVLFSAIAIKMNAFLMNPVARGGNLGAIYPAIEQIVGDIRSKTEGSSIHETEDKIALTMMALIKDGFIHSNELTVHLFFSLIKWDALSDGTLEKLAEDIYEFVTASSLDDEKRSDNKYGKLFYYPIIMLEETLSASSNCEKRTELIKYLKETKNFDGIIKYDEIAGIYEANKDSDIKSLMAENVAHHIEEYKSMNRLSSFERVKITCPECGSEDIANAPEKKFFLGKKKPKTFKCNSCGYSW